MHKVRIFFLYMFHEKHCMYTVLYSVQNTVKILWDLLKLYILVVPEDTLVFSLFSLVFGWLVVHVVLRFVICTCILHTVQCTCTRTLYTVQCTCIRYADNA